MTVLPWRSLLIRCKGQQQSEAASTAYTFCDWAKAWLQALRPVIIVLADLLLCRIESSKNGTMHSVGCKGASLSSARSEAQALLQDPGYAVVPLSDQVAASLTIALKAFDGQLGSWGQHPPPAGYTGFTAFPRKSRLEFRPGHAGLGNLGVLQKMALQVCVVGTCC